MIESLFFCQAGPSAAWRPVPPRFSERVLVGRRRHSLRPRVLLRWLWRSAPLAPRRAGGAPRPRGAEGAAAAGRGRPPSGRRPQPWRPIFFEQHPIAHGRFSSCGEDGAPLERRRSARREWLHCVNSRWNALKRRTSPSNFSQQLIKPAFIWRARSFLVPSTRTALASFPPLLTRIRRHSSRAGQGNRRRLSGASAPPPFWPCTD